MCGIKPEISYTYESLHMNIYHGCDHKKFISTRRFPTCKVVALYSTFPNNIHETYGMLQVFNRQLAIYMKTSPTLLFHMTIKIIQRFLPHLLHSPLSRTS